MSGWRDILGYEGIYQVSDNGQVMRLAGSPKCHHNRMLKKSPRTNGYRFVTLCSKAVKDQRDIHVLVALAFLGPCPEGLEINHIDTDKTNNNIENLEYVTRGQNMKHAYRLGLIPDRTGGKNPNSSIAPEDILQIRDLYRQGVSRKELLKRFPYSKTAIRDIVLNLSWRNYSGPE